MKIWAKKKASSDKAKRQTMFAQHVTFSNNLIARSEEKKNVIN